MHKAGFINIIGNPNVGKSTLMNCLVGEKLSIITSKAQTTRHRILGIVNGDNFQLIISDTPGIIKPSYELQSSMMDFVKSALEDADVLVYMIEIGEKSIKDIEVHNKINNAKVPVIILLNKIDLLSSQERESLSGLINTCVTRSSFSPPSHILRISAQDKIGTDQVIECLAAMVSEDDA